MDGDERVLTSGSILVAEGRIQSVHASADAETDRQMLGRFTPERVIEATGMIALPGLVNCHTHTTEILLRGAGGADRSLYDWQWNLVYPASLAYSTEDVYTASLLYAVDALRAGTTTFVDNSNSARSRELALAALQAYERSRARAVLAPVFAVAPLPDDGLLTLGRAVQGSDVRVPPEAMLLKLDDVATLLASLMAEHGDLGDDRIAVWPAPHKPNRTSVASLELAHSLVQRHGGMVSQPCAEVAAERDVGDVSAVEHLARVGALNERTLLGHCVHVSDVDIVAIASAGASLAHVPVANLFLGSGIAPVPAMRAGGVTTGLGTDNANCNDTTSILREATLAALIHKGVTEDAEAMRAADALSMATRDGARAIGRDDLGALEAGRRADIVLLDADRAALTPLHDPVAAVVYQAFGGEVHTTIVGGEILMDAGTLTFMTEDDEVALRDEAQRRSSDLLGRISRPRPTSGS
jgi:cytosine/adenosine deaminase-related metal-dependent hydrolase